MKNQEVNNELLDDIQDNSGIEEIQKAIAQIEQYKTGDTQAEVDKTDNDNERVEVNQEENIEEDLEPQREKKKSLEEDKSWEARREKYRLLVENEALKAQLNDMNSMLEDSLHTGTYHYGKNVYAELERAKSNLKRAIEEGDAEALVQEIPNVARATNMVNELERMTTPAEPKGIDQDSRPSATQLYNEIAGDWLDDHPELSPNSRSYNPEIAEKVAGFINSLDKKLARNGQHNAYFSPGYFNTIEQYMADIKNQGTKNRNPESASYIGGVRSHHSSSVNGKNSTPSRMILTADEKRMAANAGISEKEWLKFKLEDMQQQARRG